MYDYGYTTDAIEASTSMFGILGGLTLGIFIFSSIIGLIAIISYAKIFKKAGKPWWASIVPIYNTIVMIEIAKLPMWYIALFFVPIANIYAIFKINIEIAKNFGKDAGFGIGMTLLSIIFIPLLAFSDNVYDGTEISTTTVNKEFDARNVINSGVSSNIPLETENVNITVAPIEVANSMVTPVEPEPMVTPVEPEPMAAPVEPEPMVAPVELEPMAAPVAPEPMVTPVAPEPVVAPVAPEPMVAPVPTEPVNQQNEMNAFNMVPEATQNTVLNANSTEIDLATNLAEDKKICKNCGNELPDIVSICPNCGTDNE